MIRIWNKNDIDRINNLGLKLIPNFLKSYNIKNYLDNDKYIIIVNEGASINAFMIIFNNIDFYELEAIYVDENYRNQGIATKMINYFLENFFNKDKKDILLEVAVTNKNAISLYQSFGFEIISTRKKYYQDKDAYIMKKVNK